MFEDGSGPVGKILKSAPAGVMPGADRALLDLFRLLKATDYRFVTPTPATHARVVARPKRQDAASLADVLGWSLPFRPGVIDPAIASLLDKAGMLEPAGERFRSRLRVSTLHGQLFLHSAYPTDAEDAVFFGPDSYRFADLIASELALRPLPAAPLIVDIGTGSGVGAIVAGRLHPDASIWATDINPHALRFAELNAAAAGVAIDAVRTGSLAGIPGGLDLAIANPPYMIDARRRAYRDGRGARGDGVALMMAGMALPLLATGGRVILYTGSAVVRGEDHLAAALAGAAARHGCTIAYRELDPDVFGEELDSPAYLDVDRIALVAAVITRPR